MGLAEFLTARTCDCGRAGKLTRSMCTRCYRYWLDHTPVSQRPPAPRFARGFWDSVDKGDPCWTWTGPSDAKGYGRWGKEVASRHSWVLAHGPIPAGMWVLHHCDNPPCVNPEHLYLGTVTDNVRDAVERGRIYRPPFKEVCTEGHPKTGDNLRIVRNRDRVIRLCRKCDNRRSADRQRRRRAAAWS